VAQHAVARPLGELDLGDELGANESGAAGRVAADERRRVDREGLEEGLEAGELGLGEPGSGR
jgi:hypothetical protein